MFYRGMMADARSIAARDPAARSVAQVYFLYPGFRALRMYHMAHWFQQHKWFSVARYISQRCRHKTGIEIHPAAQIGKGLFIDHGMGVVIGETARIGDDCTIYHGVTLGGTGKDVGKRHPTLGNNVLVGAGSKILGPCTIGDNVRIGANAVVLSDVEPGATVVGVPGRSVRRMKEAPSPAQSLDQVHIPDPVSQELCRMQQRILELERRMEKQNGQENVRVKGEEA